MKRERSITLAGSTLALAAITASLGCGGTASQPTATAEARHRPPAPPAAGVIIRSIGPEKLAKPPVVVAEVGSEGVPGQIDLYVRTRRKVKLGDQLATSVNDAVMGSDSKRGYDGFSQRGNCYIATAPVDVSDAELIRLRAGDTANVTVHITTRAGDSTIRARVPTQVTKVDEDSNGAGSSDRYAQLGCSRASYTVEIDS